MRAIDSCLLLFVTRKRDLIEKILFEGVMITK